MVCFSQSKVCLRSNIYRSWNSPNLQQTHKAETRNQKPGTVYQKVYTQPVIRDSVTIRYCDNEDRVVLTAIDSINTSNWFGKKWQRCRWKLTWSRSVVEERKARLHRRRKPRQKPRSGTVPIGADSHRRSLYHSCGSRRKFMARAQCQPEMAWRTKLPGSCSRECTAQRSPSSRGTEQADYVVVWRRRM